MHLKMNRWHILAYNIKDNPDLVRPDYELHEADDGLPLQLEHVHGPVVFGRALVAALPQPRDVHAGAQEVQRRARTQLLAGARLLASCSCGAEQRGRGGAQHAVARLVGQQRQQVRSAAVTTVLQKIFL